MRITQTKKDGSKEVVFHAKGVLGFLLSLAFMGIVLAIVLAALWPLWVALAALKYLFT